MIGLGNSAKSVTLNTHLAAYNPQREKGLKNVMMVI